MERAFIIDKFNTFSDWRLVLTAKSVTPPQAKTNYVSIDGMSGTLDLSESLTGEITYNDRTVTASFLITEGTFKDRNKLIREIVSKLHGKKVKIIEPDDTEHYFYGRVTVKNINNDKAYGKIDLEAVCDPWRYSINDSVRRIELDNQTVEVVINNNGVKTLYPEITVTGSVNLKFKGGRVALTDGSYKISDLRLYSGVNIIEVSGSGAITFTYKEADI
jgi:hypothetical protein